MADLIPFAPRQIGNETVATVNGRDLHTFLGIKTEYQSWFVRRVKAYNFSQDIDYTDAIFGDGPMKTIEHHLSLNMAKELSMVERTAKGKEARLYFLACEKAAQHHEHLPQVKNPAHQMLIETIIRLDAVEQRAIDAEQRASDAKAEAIQAHTKAEEAQANALRSLETQLFFTVAEYAYVNTLQGQLPREAYKDCSAALRLYCLDRNIPFRKQAVGGQRWDDEYAFHSSVYAEVLPGWLKRRYAQSPLRVVTSTGEEGAE